VKHERIRANPEVPPAEWPFKPTAKTHRCVVISSLPLRRECFRRKSLFERVCEAMERERNAA